MQDIRDLIREREEQLLSSDVRHSSDALKHLLAPDFVEFGASGRIWDREGVAGRLLRAQPVQRLVENFQVRVLAPGVVLATYQVKRLRSDKSIAAASLRSSVWTSDGDDWRLVFHQGTSQPL